ncbi:hypothetical protein [Bifidobacterium olomucense]|uniref:Uncharacterized protein n=1 Tax=Bifidobacterium olomucense TaxID=2675324 RepID=A0A7Y0EX94_9BIFI|nr:hypothetical protein [Bifidobacterium sp. DSM 109959]NMM98108.1 hypothetical protein [Bifidobacterium sp. DSM 109959]
MSYYLYMDPQEKRHECPDPKCPEHTYSAVMHCACGKWYVVNGYLPCSIGVWKHRPAWWVRLFYREAFDKLEHDDTDIVYMEES